MAIGNHEPRAQMQLGLSRRPDFFRKRGFKGSSSSARGCVHRGGRTFDGSVTTKSIAHSMNIYTEFAYLAMHFPLVLCSIELSLPPSPVDDAVALSTKKNPNSPGGLARVYPPRAADAAPSRSGRGLLKIQAV